MWLVISLNTLLSRLKMTVQYIEWLQREEMAYQSPKECFEMTGKRYYYEVEWEGNTYYIPTGYNRPISVTETQVVNPKLYEG